MHHSVPQPQSPVWTLAALTVLEGARHRLFWILPGLVLVGLSLAGFAGSLALTEAGPLRGALLGAFLRLTGVILTAVYVLHSQSREYQDKGLELIFALPLTRTAYLLGKLAGYAVLVSCMVTVFAGVLLFFADPMPVVVWGVSLLMELWLVVAFSLLVQWTIHALPAAFLLVLLFYLLARILADLQWVGQGVLMPQGGLYWQAVNTTLAAIAWVLPSLDRFTRSEWLAYGSGGWDDLLFVLAQGSGYLLLLTGASLVDLYRKSL
ncbi:MAG: ABC transporter permease [Magnetococcus sp. DMHC-8]